MRLIVLVSALVTVAASALLYSNSKVSAADFSEDHRVVLFTAPWCGYCDRARAHLNERQVGFLEIDVESSAEAQQLWRDAGGRGVPLAFFESQRIAGYSRESYDRLMDSVSD
ncbi:MAG: glutaredoxin domain-containing protein [Pseudomonadota bacterium]